MAPSVSITLIGKSYFLCAGGHNIAYDGTADQSLRNAFRHGPSVHNIYVAIADDESYYIHYHDQTGNCFNSRNLDDSYSGLNDYLDEEDVHCPNCVSLSPGGYYFMRTPGGRAWLLPDALDTMVTKAKNSGKENPLRNVWFGKDDTYVAQGNDGSISWSLQGYYGSLGQTLKYGTKRIKSLGLNLTDGSSYIALWMDGTHQFNPGECALSKDDLKNWIFSFA